MDKENLKFRKSYPRLDLDLDFLEKILQHCMLAIFYFSTVWFMHVSLDKDGSLH